MSTTGSDVVKATLDEHAEFVSNLHEKLAATPGINQDQLQKAVDKLQGAVKAFHDDALGCMN